ncbi:MAG: hypothetical protein HY695_03760 [Deltaproteobacteria bacterium]|nr:hypothetical protein [Deltaproteobacteria bacterium]
MAWPKVKSHVLDLADSLDALLATIQDRLDRNDRNLCLFNLGARAMHEVRRVAQALEGDIEDSAWRVRNLHEIDLTLRYILQSDEHLAEWTGQMLTDEKDVVEGFMTLAAKLSPRDRARLEERLARIRETSTRLGLEMRRPWLMRNLAKATNREREYQMFYKFFSKFVHPSAWLVNGRWERTGGPTYRNLIVGLTQGLCRRIYGLLFDEYRLDERDIVPGSHSRPWVPESE